MCWENIISEGRNKFTLEWQVGWDASVTCWIKGRCCDLPSQSFLGVLRSLSARNWEQHWAVQLAIMMKAIAILVVLCGLTNAMVSYEQALLGFVSFSCFLEAAPFVQLAQAETVSAGVRQNLRLIRHSSCVPVQLPTLQVLQGAAWPRPHTPERALLDPNPHRTPASVLRDGRRWRRLHFPSTCRYSREQLRRRGDLRHFQTKRPRSAQVPAQRRKPALHTAEAAAIVCRQWSEVLSDEKQLRRLQTTH